MGLLGSLGLDEVEADPNNIPDGRYDGFIKSDELVVKKNGEVSLVITYKVSEGDRKGAERTEWYTLGKDPVRNPTTQAVEGYTPTMDETAKSWFKKRLVDCGLNEQQIADYEPGDLANKKVTFGVKRNGNFININFVELREAPEGAEPSTGSGAVTGAL